MVTNYLICRATFETKSILGYAEESFQNDVYQKISTHVTPIRATTAEGVEQAIDRVAELGHSSTEEAEQALSSYLNLCADDGDFVWSLGDDEDDQAPPAGY